jgi:hypothetical protein
MALRKTPHPEQAAVAAVSKDARRFPNATKILSSALSIPGRVERH